MNPPLTIVMPVYNEAALIRDTIAEIQSHIFSVVPSAELLVIDDGSRDGTPAALAELGPQEPRMRVIHQSNAGHGAALRAGIEQAHGDFILVIDSDRQIPLSVFRELWPEAQKNDATLGVRTHRRDPIHRLILSRVVKLSLWLMFRVWLRDSNCPFKIFRRGLWEGARAYIPEGTLAPSLFLAIYTARSPYQWIQSPVPHQARPSGVSTLRVWRLFRFCLHAFGQLVHLEHKLAP
jgi:dolichol-phosphate mannosyltransferase